MLICEVCISQINSLGSVENGSLGYYVHCWNAY